MAGRSGKTDSPEKGRTHIGSRPVKVIRRVGAEGRGRGRAGQLVGGGGGRGGPRWGCGVPESRLVRTGHFGEAWCGAVG